LTHQEGTLADVSQQGTGECGVRLCCAQSPQALCDTGQVSLPQAWRYVAQSGL